MSERANRFVLGFSLIGFLRLEWNNGVYAIITILIFEGTTNWRIPALVSQLRYAMNGINRGGITDTNNDNNYKFYYEAERLLRFMVATTISLGFIFFDDSLWFLPWFVGLNLLLAGTTGFCPLIMLFRKLGFR